jgi:hypothetical protein
MWSEESRPEAQAGPEGQETHESAESGSSPLASSRTATPAEVEALFAAPEFRERLELEVGAMLDRWQRGRAERR